MPGERSSHSLETSEETDKGHAWELALVKIEIKTEATPQIIITKTFY